MAKKRNKKDQKNESGEVYRHDTFFRKVFSERDNAQSFLQSFLPEALAGKIDFSTLQLEATSYISEHLESYYSDLIWSARYDGHAVKISFLLEHKSFVPRFPHVQLLRYMAEGYERQIKNDKTLAVILPIVLYHGRRKWPLKSFEAYFSGITDDLRQYVPDFQYRLVDLSRYAYEDLIKMPLKKAVPGILALKFVHDADFLRQHFALIFVNVEQFIPSDTEYLKTILLYLFQNAKMDANQLDQIMKNTPQPVKHAAMSAYDAIMAKGREEGRQEGREKGRQEGREAQNRHLIGMLIRQTEFDDAKIAQLTGVAEQYVRDVRAELNRS